MNIRIADPQLGDEEVAAVEAVLRSGNLAQGPKVAELEERWAEVAGTRHAVALSNGTVAIHASMAALGVGPGDEVITTPFTFIGSVNPALMLGATVRFVDIRPDDFCLNADLLASAITPRTKAVVAVDLFGQPFDVGAVEQICMDHGVRLLDDACQAIGAAYQGRPAGSFGDLGCFSLYATKNVTCGEGGMVTTDDPDLAARVRLLRQHCMVDAYDYENLGYNYRLTDIQAAIALVQLRRLPELTAARQNNATRLTVGLADIPGVVLPRAAMDRTHVFHQYTIRITAEARHDREDVLTSLRANGVGAGVYYPVGLHRVAHVAQHAAPCVVPETDRAATEVLSLPVHPGVTAAQVDQIVEVTRASLGA